MSLRTYHDPLHGAIQLDSSCPGEAMAIDLIDTAPFQRLRRIRQLGTAYLTFQGAESSRFTHSLGVLHLARQALGQLERQGPRLQEHRSCLLAAALLTLLRLMALLEVVPLLLGVHALHALLQHLRQLFQHVLHLLRGGLGAPLLHLLAQLLLHLLVLLKV